ncbi:hypothetical protein ASG73_11725 [Janibacter sp. Soil728]|uniref:hypothetical protein n=1 Tax=Janibacter sp. Soil728 TaxID=1736393 RepID=UPI0006F535E2|nr:hypothetical protein [Janibacter sp. Soil728]KRE36977.1 hypothetical protein ASG73_11725 [Janibacter sp. Soil728]
MSTTVEGVEAIALRLVLPPLCIALATLAQHRLGDRLGGVVVGLPLTSGTFLGIVLLTHGRAAVTEAAAGMLAGQISVIAMTVAYAWLAGRAGVLTALLGTVAAWAGSVALVQLVDGPLAAGLVYVVVAAATLGLWPRCAAPAKGSPLRPRRYLTAGRIALGSGLVITLTAGMSLLGPALAGTLAAAPLVALVITPSTHRTRGVDSTRVLLGGVARGSVGAAVFAVVLFATASVLGGPSLLVATTACLSVVALVGRGGRGPQREERPSAGSPP